MNNTKKETSETTLKFVDTFQSNEAIISGTIASDVLSKHEASNQTLLSFIVNVERLSGINDSIIVMVPEKKFPAKQIKFGKYVHIKGQFRSFNKREDGAYHLFLYLFAYSIEFVENNFLADINELSLTCYIVKKPTLRRTPGNKIISDVTIAVHRSYGKSDYLPCIFWGQNAYLVAGLEIGQQIKLIGRMQSRIYTKVFPDGDTKDFTVYEVSVMNFEVL